MLLGEVDALLPALPVHPTFVDEKSCARRKIDQPKNRIKDHTTTMVASKTSSGSN